jgi:hypothetical protein
MKLMRYGARDGAKIPCILDADGFLWCRGALILRFTSKTAARRSALPVQRAFSCSSRPIASTAGSMKVRSPLSGSGSILSESRTPAGLRGPHTHAVER